jgi:hypothetical protein
MLGFLSEKPTQIPIKRHEEEIKKEEPEDFNFAMP